MHVASIHTYPIKSCYRTDHDAVTVEPWGCAGDRRWVILDENGVMMTQRQIPGLVHVKPRAEGTKIHLAAAGHPDLSVECRPGPLTDMRVFSDPVRVSPVGLDADAWLAAVTGRRLHLYWLDDPTRRPVLPGFSMPADRVSLADEFPILFTNTASLNSLNDALIEGGSDEGPLPMTRFRPNFVITGATPWAEDGWVGRRIRVGDLTFRVARGHGRCVITTTDQDTGVRGTEPLRTLGRIRNVDQSLLFGAAAIPDAPGVVTIGDEVTVL
jgi:uncharacterized protein YcbX